ncbi:hypothetical protein DMA11_00975 [Marinilabiliaceae bacterium JC017]|nr:hypothetical protein DMA11_00975 [Marinilabiliaceae bacterium JC017]
MVTFAIRAQNFTYSSKDSINGKPKAEGYLFFKMKLNGVYDLSGGLHGLETFNVGKIDVWDDQNIQNFSMDMHQSQIRLFGSRQINGHTAKGYFEGDFWAGNKVARLRHAWVDYQFIHFGQDWSFFGDKDIWPNVFDWDGPPSGVWRREPQLQFYFWTDDNWKFEVGIEQPGSEITYDEDIDPNIMPAKNNKFPDFIATVKKKKDWGHLRLATIMRNLSYCKNESDESILGYGAAVSGYLSTSETYDNPIQFQFVYGKGIATYLVSFSGLNYDAAPDGSGNVEAIPVFGGWLSYEKWLSEKWHGNIVLGMSDFSTSEINEFYVEGGKFNVYDGSMDLNHYYGLVNIMYDPFENFTLGVEYNLGYKENVYHGDIVYDETGENHDSDRLSKGRNAHRISFGLFYNF